MSEETGVGIAALQNVGGGSAEVNRLRREHSELEARLSELNNRIYLSPREEFERKQLQKLKLAKKDRLAALCVGG